MAETIFAIRCNSHRRIIQHDGWANNTSAKTLALSLFRRLDEGHTPERDGRAQRLEDSLLAVDCVRGGAHAEPSHDACKSASLLHWLAHHTRNLCLCPIIYCPQSRHPNQLDLFADTPIDRASAADSLTARISDGTSRWTTIPPREMIHSHWLKHQPQMVES